ncbi:MAG TPA: HAD domain-containing protein, partial [Candidatus Paceibacterota bacterium]
PLLVRKLHTIIRETGAHVVLSSTWRLDEWSRKAVQEQVVHFIDRTPFLGTPRWQEIQDWLNQAERGITKSVCLDDNSDCEIPNRPDYLFIQTDENTGLDDEDVERAIEFLGRQ